MGNVGNHFLNIMPVEALKGKVQVGVLRFESAEQLNDLRDSNFDTHVFQRDGEKVISVSTDPGSKALGDLEERDLEKDLTLAVRLIREALTRAFVTQGLKLVRREPLRVRSNNAEKEMLSEVLQRLKLPSVSWLSVRQAPEITVRKFNFPGRKPFVGLVVGASTSLRIDLTCDQLVKEGVALSGLYLTKRVPSRDKRHEDEFITVGRVQTFDKESAELVDVRDGEENQVKLRDCYLEPRLENVELCLKAKLGEKSDIAMAALRVQLHKASTGPSYHSQITAFGNWLRKLKVEVLPGTNLHVNEFLQSGQGLFPAIKAMDRPVFVFNPTRDRTHEWPDPGIKRHGPYDRSTFHIPKPNILVICQRHRQGEVEQFIHNFLEGMPNVKNSKGFAIYDQGFFRKFYLEKGVVEVFTADGDSVSAYENAIKKAIQKSTDQGRQWNLALVQIDESFRSRHPEENPYLAAKAMFLRHQIASQKFKMETAVKPPTEQAFALNQMSLACYAKMGGLPWLLSATPGVSHELVIGIGSAYVSESRLGPKQRIVGITTVFSGDGNYILEKRSRAVPYDGFMDALLESLRTTVTDVRKQLNWRPQDSLRLVFHSFKPFRGEEVSAIKALMTELTADLKVQFAFLQLITNHPFLLMDMNQQGFFDPVSKGRKGALAPVRGTYLEMSPFEILLTFTGPSELKRPEDGLPNGTLVKVHRESTFNDVRYLARQAFFFSAHSWRSFMPASAPVTTGYSMLIARLLGDLSRLSDWNDDVMAGTIGATRWFL